MHLLVLLLLLFYLPFYFPIAMAAFTAMQLTQSEVCAFLADW
jgi:hypothetical protein